MAPIKNDKRFTRFNIKKYSGKAFERNIMINDSEHRFLPRLVSSSLSIKEKGHKFDVFSLRKKLNPVERTIPKKKVLDDFKF